MTGTRTAQRPLELYCDVAVIGAGTAGLAAERTARHAGASTLLIDQTFCGGTCANVGCMPSKLLIAAGNAAEAVLHAAKLGILAVPSINPSAVLTRVRKERDRFASATREEIAKLPPGVALRGTARFVGGGALALDDGRHIRARSVVVATGSRPSVPQLFEPIREVLLTNETLFELTDLPRSMAVVGAGPLGIELAQALARLNVSITVFDEANQIAGAQDPEVAAEVGLALARELDLFLGVKLRAEMCEGGARLRWDGVDSGERYFERVLVATGREPQVQALDLHATGLELDARGVPVFDRKTMQCGASAIFLAGDAAADRPVLHEASAEGAIAGSNAASFPKVSAQHRGVPFSLIFTDPPLALIGQRAGDDLVSGNADYRTQGRATVEAQAHGWARLHASAADGQLLGATLFCPGADHLAHLLAWAIESGLTASALLDRPFYHPTLEEGLKPALRQICKAVGVVEPAAQDEGTPSGA